MDGPRFLYAVLQGKAAKYGEAGRAAGKRKQGWDAEGLYVSCQVDEAARSLYLTPQLQTVSCDDAAFGPMWDDGRCISLGLSSDVGRMSMLLSVIPEWLLNS